MVGWQFLESEKVWLLADMMFPCRVQDLKTLNNIIPLHSQQTSKSKKTQVQGFWSKILTRALQDSKELDK